VSGPSGAAPDPYVALADEAAHAEVLRVRAEERARREAASALATWIGTLRDLAETARTVTVQTAAGRSHRGVLAAVGIDHLALVAPSGVRILVRLDAVCLVRPAPDRPAPPASGDRDRSQDRALGEALEPLVGSQVTLGLAGGHDPVRGRLVALGEDVVTLRLDGPDRGGVYLPLAAVEEVVLTP
jgi:hypothetical protein